MNAIKFPTSVDHVDPTTQFTTLVERFRGDSGICQMVRDVVKRNGILDTYGAVQNEVLQAAVENSLNRERPICVALVGEEVRKFHMYSSALFAQAFIATAHKSVSSQNASANGVSALRIVGVA